MSANVTIDSRPNRLRIELRQTLGEVVRLGLFVAVLVVAVYALTPAARSSPGWLLALLALAAVWSTIALSAREIYTLDRTAGAIIAERSSLLGARRQTLESSEVAAVHLAMGGPDDNRRLVELVDREGRLRLRLPGRITTLSERDQSEIGRAIAACLGVPCREN
jgi:hypothetical protein